MLNEIEMEQQNVRLAAAHLPLLFALQNLMKLVWFGFGFFLQNSHKTPQWPKISAFGFFCLFFK